MNRLLLILALACCFLFCGGLITAYADYENECSNSETTSNQGHEHCYTDTDTDTDTHADRDDPAGVGADILIAEGEHIDLVAEYRYDFPNEEHSIFGVFKTKTSLWSIIKGIFSRGE